MGLVVPSGSTKPLVVLVLLTVVDDVPFSVVLLWVAVMLEMVPVEVEVLVTGPVQTAAAAATTTTTTATKTKFNETCVSFEVDESTSAAF